jgi:hypothetical protein
MFNCCSIIVTYEEFTDKYFSVQYISLTVSHTISARNKHWRCEANNYTVRSFCEAYTPLIAARLRNVGIFRHAHINCDPTDINKEADTAV